MVQSLASKLVMAARAAGYHELPVGPRKVTFRSICPACKNKRVIRFHKVGKVKGPKVIDRCYGCGYKATVKAGKAAKA